MITASSTTVLANLAYLIGAVVVAVIIGLVVWFRHRQPKSVDATISSFQRGLSALAPEEGSGGHFRSSSEPPRIRQAPIGLSHVRVDPAGQGTPAPAAEELGGGEAG